MGALEIHWRGGAYPLDGVDGATTLADLRLRVAALTGHAITPSAMRLLHAGRQLPGGDGDCGGGGGGGNCAVGGGNGGDVEGGDGRPNGATRMATLKASGVPTDATPPAVVLVLAPPSADLSALTAAVAAAPDRRLRPLGDGVGHDRSPLTRGGRPRIPAATPARTGSGLSPSAYGFGAVEVLPLPGADAARALLTSLATDAGVLAVMRARSWRVGRLCEMPASGKVGIDPVCVLGFNVNAGQEIRLRLRTDDGAGLRSRWKVLEVLWHELTHNVWSDHDARFYALMSEISREGGAVNAARRGGRRSGRGSGSGSSGSSGISDVSGSVGGRGDNGGGGQPERVPRSATGA